jgi:peroxiredoxin
MTASSSTSVDAAPSPAASSGSAATAGAPELVLAQTPAERLGSAPAGFGPELGAPAPDATLPDVSGKMQSLHTLYARGPTLLVFYRGGWCPFCNLQLRELVRAKPEFDRRGVQIVAISVDRPSEEAKTEARHGVAFPMLSDPSLAAHRSYRVIHVPGEKERKFLAGLVDLASYSGESHGNFATPASILVDRSGVVRFVHVDEDFKTRPSAEQLLAVVDRTLG